MFVGVYDRSIDDSGRLGLPSQFRTELGDRCYATLDPQGCITIRTVGVFESDAQEVIEGVKDGRLTRAQRRSIATNTIAVTIDKQGRLTLEEKARQFAGLVAGEQAMIVGNLNSIEIWRPSRYDTVESEDRDESQPRKWED